MKTIGKYKIRGLLGRGGMGKVYKVELPVIGKIAALKLLSPNPHLVHLMGENAIRNLFISEAIKYTRQILLGLACLHHFGIVHRDIKPFNILVTDIDTIKICDFGLSKLRGEDFKGPENLKVGSPWYAAPEQEANPDKVDRRADIYSVGIMLYRMLTGELPAETYEKPSKINADLDPTWDAFIAKAIATEHQNRFGDANQMVKQLDRLDNAWKEKKENICNIVPESTDAKKLPCHSIKLRNHTVKVNPRHGEDFCMEPVFDTRQKWLWSCDRRSYMAAWYVNADMGFVSWQDFSAYYYVRGVCDDTA